MKAAGVGHYSRAVNDGARAVNDIIIWLFISKWPLILLMYQNMLQTFWGDADHCAN